MVNKIKGVTPPGSKKIFCNPELVLNVTPKHKSDLIDSFGEIYPNMWTILF